MSGYINQPACSRGQLNAEMALVFFSAPAVFLFFLYRCFFMAAIEVEHLTKHYGPSRGVDDLSFSVEKGEIMGFLGPNGSGKTTTMRILTGFFPPTRGAVRVCGYDVVRHARRARSRIGYMPENVPLYLDMPVSGYLLFFAEVKGVPAGRRSDHVAEIMHQCGLDHVSHRLIGRLSKGYRQRVGLAQALLNDPEVLILDEPTIGLDPKQIIEIRSLIRGLGQTRTVMLSTHILPEVSMTCDRVVIIHEGRMVAVDTPEKLMKQIMKVPRLLVRSDGPAEAVAEALKTVEGVRHVEPVRMGTRELDCCEVEAAESPHLVNALAACVRERGWCLREIKPADMTLEEIFIQLITQQEQNRQ
jgi:ABC-2 type transport system ATP-binding protein